MIFKLIEVESYCGYRPDERPISFAYQDEKFEVSEILERWYEGGTIAGQPVYAYFKVKTVSGGEFLLRYNTRFKTWAIRIS